MKHHIMIALGLLMAGIFSYQAAFALQSPGLGLWELYLLGGLILAAAIIRKGLIERRLAKSAAPDGSDHTG